MVNFTRDISKNNLIYLFSNEGLPHLIKMLRSCLPKEEAIAKSAKEGPKPQAELKINVYNVIVCLDLMSMCCEGKSDVAEKKCQQEIVNLQTAYFLYSHSGKLWPFKCCILKYISHCYLDSGNENLFKNQNNIQNLKSLFEAILEDMITIQEEWHSNKE